MPQDERASASRHVTLLATGRVEVVGRMPWSSNRTFLAVCSEGEEVVPAVYKPVRGERPLWDFRGGLYRREVAAYELSEALGWAIVPETVVRQDAPLGVGSMQKFVECDHSQHYFTLLEEPRHHDGLRAIAVFDLLANNADRKGGHCLLGDDSRIWAIDNALCFHPEPKLRTVMWDFSDEEIPAALLADIGRLSRDSLPQPLQDLLDEEERRALRLRMRAVVKRARFPAPSPGLRPYPWPLV
jgi:uncharacterized repeat protein (TIGR03843 family)